MDAIDNINDRDMVTDGGSGDEGPNVPMDGVDNTLGIDESPIYDPDAVLASDDQVGYALEDPDITARREYIRHMIQVNRELMSVPGNSREHYRAAQTIQDLLRDNRGLCGSTCRSMQDDDGQEQVTPALPTPSPTSVARADNPDGNNQGMGESQEAEAEAVTVSGNLLAEGSTNRTAGMSLRPNSTEVQTGNHQVATGQRVESAVCGKLSDLNLVRRDNVGSTLLDSQSDKDAKMEDSTAEESNSALPKRESK